MSKKNQEDQIEYLKSNVSSMIRARYPYIWIQTQEEHRILETIENIAAEVNREAFVFDFSNLWQPISAWRSDDLYIEGDIDRKILGSTTLIDSLKGDVINCINAEKKYLLIFPDFHFYIRNTELEISQNLIRILKWLNPKIRNSFITIIFISNSVSIPNEISDIVHVEIMRPPSKKEIDFVLGEIIEDLGRKLTIPEDVRNQMISSALGLTLNQAKRLFSLSITKNYDQPSKMVDVIVKGKKGIISSTGALEFFAPNEVPTYLAGLDALKEWLQLRKDAFSPDAEKYNLPKPKGVFLMGIPGTGKSLTAKFIAGTWKMPLLRFDVGAVYGSYVGQTEATLRQALHIIEAISPAILWIDEIEKAISTGPDLDSGVSKRVLGAFLTWMQENAAPIFVIATANDISNLPPELMRKGRFDEIFFLELPNKVEREGIFRVHLENVGREPDNFDIDGFVSETEGFTGAEIEQAIKEGLYIAFSNKHRPLEDNDIFLAIRNTKPLSETKKEMIDRLNQMVERQEVRSATKPLKISKKREKVGLEIEGKK